MKPDFGVRVAQVLLALLKAACYVLLFLGVQVLVMLPVLIASAIQTVVGGGPLDGTEMAALLKEEAMTYSLIANLLTLVIVLTFYLIRRKRFSEALWLRPVDTPTLWEGAALAPGLYLLVSVVLIFLPKSWLEEYNEASSGIISGGMVGIMAVAVAAPVVEEIIFRGLIMTRLSNVMSNWLAVLLSAAIFGACHGNAVWFGYAFVLGALFGLMDLRAGSIWPSILGHVVFNSIDQILSLLPENDTAETAAVIVLLMAAVVAPILDRKAIAAIFKPKPKAPPFQALPAEPGVYDFDPWDA